MLCISVANALFHFMRALGIILSIRLLITVFRSGALILRGAARSGWSVMSRVSDRLSGT